MKNILNRKNKGFTLIELMIVVAIIGILAAIAIPNFIRYQLRSKTAEARTNIGGIKTSQESFRSSEDNYANITQQRPPALPGTVKTDWQGMACANCDRTQTNNCNEFTCIGFEPAGQVYYQYQSPHQLAAAMVVAEFAIEALGDLDGDTQLGSFCLQSSNTVGNTQGIVACPLANAPCNAAGLNPSEVTDCNAGVY